MHVRKVVEHPIQAADPISGGSSGPKGACGQDCPPPKDEKLSARFYAGGAEIIEQLSGPWAELCRDGDGDLPFYRPEWIGAYLRAFAPHSPLLVAAAHKGDRLAGLLPLVEDRFPFRIAGLRRLRSAANTHSCRFDLVRAPGREGDEAARAIWALLRDRPGWDLIELNYVPEGAALDGLLAAAAGDGFLISREPLYTSPYISLAGVTAAAAIPESAHFRQNQRRRVRKAQESHGIRLTCLDRGEPAALDAFYELEQAGWKGRDGSAISCRRQTRQFYDEIARAAAANGTLALYLLDLGERTVAAFFGLRQNGRFYALKVAYDESYSFYAPGHLLVEFVLRDILARGATEFDFLGPEMEWKAKWTRTGREHSRCFIFRPGWFGRTFQAGRDRLRSLARTPAIAAVRRRLGK